MVYYKKSIMNCNIQESLTQAGPRKAVKFYQFFALFFIQRLKKYISDMLNKEFQIFEKEWKENKNLDF